MLPFALARQHGHHPSLAAPTNRSTPSCRHQRQRLFLINVRKNKKWMPLYLGIQPDKHAESRLTINLFFNPITEDLLAFSGAIAYPLLR
jgi:hypothetical protein